MVNTPVTIVVICDSHRLLLLQFCGRWHTAYPELVTAIRSKLQETARPRDTVLALKRYGDFPKDAQCLRAEIGVR
jgi:hypothetical protein